MQFLESTVTGRVINILVEVGQTIEEGDDIMTVESMKMELPVPAEKSGKVVEILVAAGDEVEEGQNVVKIEG